MEGLPEPALVESKPKFVNSVAIVGLFRSFVDETGSPGAIEEEDALPEELLVIVFGDGTFT